MEGCVCKHAIFRDMNVLDDSIHTRHNEEENMQTSRHKART